MKYRMQFLPIFSLMLFISCKNNVNFYQHKDLHGNEIDLVLYKNHTFNLKETCFSTEDLYSGYWKKLNDTIKLNVEESSLEYKVDKIAYCEETFVPTLEKNTLVKIILDDSIHKKVTLMFNNNNIFLETDSKGKLVIDKLQKLKTIQVFEMFAPEFSYVIKKQENNSFIIYLYSYIKMPEINCGFNSKYLMKGNRLYFINKFNINQNFFLKKTSFNKYNEIKKPMYIVDSLHPLKYLR